MVCAESLCCGTPVIGFRAGAPEQISIKKYSRFVQQADIEQLVYAAECILNSQYNRIEIEKEAHRIYAKNTMVEAYMGIYTKLIRMETGENEA